MKLKNKLLSAFILIFITSLIFSSFVIAGPQITLGGKSGILMEPNTGKVLFEKNPDEKLAPASVTKVMTMLLIYEAVGQNKIKWDDVVTISEHAASMGGSQIFLEPNEQQTIETLTKSIVIASANDAAVAMSEYIAGSEEAFVDLMNEKAKSLGMVNTHFVNACGLDADGHMTTARDIAIMSSELITKYPDVMKFTKVWQDTITHETRKGSTEFGLTNTNRLIKMYTGAIGLKTGSTGKALYCLSGAAERNDMKLIAVVMGSPDSKTRFSDVVSMLDYGFANYGIEKGRKAGEIVGTVEVHKGKEKVVDAAIKEEIRLVMQKGSSVQMEGDISLSEHINAPVKQGDTIGQIIYYIEGQEVGKSEIVASTDVDKIDFGSMFFRILENVIRVK